MKFNTALILAGGSSSRFGSDKAFAEINGTTLIEYVISQLDPIFSNIIISADDQDKYRNTGRPVCTDIIKNAGPLGGIHAALKTVREGYVFITACDMPFISEDLIARMQTVIHKSSPSAVVARHNGFIEPFHAFYSAELIEKIELLLKDAPCGLFAFLNKISPAVLNTDKEQTFININSQQDLITYKELLPFFNQL